MNKGGMEKVEEYFRVLCDKKILLRLKGIVYRMVVRLALLYGALANQEGSNP